MAANVQHEYYILPGALTDEELNRQSVEITNEYNSLAEPEPDLSLFDEEAYIIPKPDRMPQIHKAVSREIRYYPVLLGVCIFVVVSCLTVCMFMMQKGVNANEHLEDMKSVLMSYREDGQRIDTEIRRVCELDAVAEYAEQMGLHKASQYQIVYVGGNSRQGSIVSNADGLETGETDVWDRLKSFFD